MSDVMVIKKFDGDFTHKTNTIVTNDLKKKPYFPPVGVKLKVVARELMNVDGGAYAKIVVTDGDWGAKVALEQAVFRVDGNRLVATNIEVLGSGFLVTETLTMQDNGQMHHDIFFSDGKSGKWICEP